MTFLQTLSIPYHSRGHAISRILFRLAADGGHLSERHSPDAQRRKREIRSASWRTSFVFPMLRIGGTALHPSKDLAVSSRSSTIGHILPFLAERRDPPLLSDRGVSVRTSPLPATAFRPLLVVCPPCGRQECPDFPPAPLARNERPSGVPPRVISKPYTSFSLPGI